MGRQSNQTGDALDFYQYVLGKSGYFDGRPGGFMIAERLFVDAVDGRKVIHRLEKHSRLYDFSQFAAGSLNDGAEVLECLSRLLFNTPRCDLSSRRIEWDVA